MKYIFAFAVMLLSVADVAARQPAIRDVFKQMPDSLVGYLSENNRLDMIDFIDSRMPAEVENALGGTSRLDTLTADYLKLTLTPASVVEMRLLPYTMGGSSTAGTLLCVVTTYGDSIRESEVRFYTTGWKSVADIDNPLSPDNVRRYAVSDSLVAGMGLDAVEDVAAEASLSPSAATMTIKMTLPICLTENKVEVKPLDKSITLNWNDVSFK